MSVIGMFQQLAQQCRREARRSYSRKLLRGTRFESSSALGRAVQRSVSRLERVSGAFVLWAVRSAIIFPCAGATDCRGESSLSKSISIAREKTIGFLDTTLPRLSPFPSF